MSNLMAVFFIGIGATAVMDLWSILRKSLFGIALPNYGMVGRWLAYMRHGKFRHDSIAASAPKQGEHFIGWIAHYLIGITFAAVLVGTAGKTWILNPTIGAALVVGVATTVAPFLLMQPGMGAGFASSRTPKPNSARLHSIINHAVFGLGLYASGWALKLYCSF
ncbi:DUF2938 domain-containing protein [Motilimonas cestriensis]|uniref:DUF2938 domain-containing protein n=1 Tax=Motilimonas cestriensis TaxID=2742685 RepID=A0ABS8WBV0_9GAMM|nr:DUF2938 domain-containing protein [Motilimonas cestriensis]MCE2595755.1 DUF2938 domain-containing protein [Motilimonas cestriensis]